MSEELIRNPATGALTRVVRVRCAVAPGCPQGYYLQWADQVRPDEVLYEGAPPESSASSAAEAAPKPKKGARK